MRSIWAFILIWGVWLITPVLVDGAETVSRLFLVKTHTRKRRRRREYGDEELPTVSVIVPAHNEAAVIDRCLNSLKAQEYPHDKLEIIVVDDGSTDQTAEKVEEHVNGNHCYDGNGNGTFRLRGRPIKVGAFEGTLALVKNVHQGKAHALNAGITASSGEIIVNVDSDVVLAEGAIRSIATAFLSDPHLGAATGNIEIDWEMLEARDTSGRLILDEDGGIRTPDLSPVQMFLARSQFLEYLSSFDLGRRAQGLTRSMYTLAGACSALRRDVLTQDCLYDNTTVSEDTCLTFRLHRKDVHVGFVEDAKVYLEPVSDWDQLYSQRARWARGQLEVCGMNHDPRRRAELGRFGRFAMPKMLLFDHTLAFPRLIWAPLLLFFPVIGYPMRIVALAAVGMYVFYLGLEVVNTASVYSLSNEHTKERIERSLWALAGLPMYRFIVFHFRFSGFLVTLREEPQWTMPGPLRMARRDWDNLRVRSMEIVGMLGTVGTSVIVWVWRQAHLIARATLVAGLIALLTSALQQRKW